MIKIKEWMNGQFCIQQKLLGKLQIQRNIQILFLNQPRYQFIYFFLHYYSSILIIQLILLYQGEPLISYIMFSLSHKALLLFTIIFTFAFSKIYQMQMGFSQFAQTSSIYLTKMNFQKGVAQLVLQTKIEGIPFAYLNKISVAIIQQDEIDKNNFNFQKICNQSKLRTFLHVVEPGGVITKTEYNLQLKDEHTLYFVLNDCNLTFQNQYSNYDLRLKLKLSLYNNGSHLSSDEDTWYYFIIICIISIYLIIKSEGFRIDSVQFDCAKFTLTLGLTINTLGLICKCLNFTIKQNFGEDYVVLQTFYLGMYALSQTILISLIVLISYGWSINYMSNSYFNSYLPWIFIIGVFNILLTLVNKLSLKTFDQYHMYDSNFGELMIYLRYFLLAIYSIGLIISYKESNQNAKKFIVKFGFYGVFYFVGLPVLVIFTQNNVKQLYQKEFLLLSIEGFKLIANMGLCYTLVSTRSSYAKICYKNVSFLEAKSQQFF